MPRLLLLFAVFFASTVGIIDRAAQAQSYAYFPPLRTYEPQFLRRPFRLPVDALLEVKSPLQLAERSVGTIPTFAAAPVVDALTNPFAGAAETSLAGAATDAGGDADPFASDDFTASTDAPSDGTDPFATDDSAGTVGSDPFADSDTDTPAGTGTNADPFADDDPFADF